MLASGASSSASTSLPANSSTDVVLLTPKPKQVLLQECRDLLHFLWLCSRAFDNRTVRSTDFEESFDWDSTREVRHVVHGRPGGKFGEVECSWLRVELKGMDELQPDEDEGEGSTSYHGTRWSKLPWILQERCLRGGPREAGGKNGVWTSPAFKTAETYAWPEPLGTATAPHFNPWAHLEKSTSDELFQAVLELEVLQWRKHSRSVYVTMDARKAALRAVHFRCWRVGAEDHAELRQAYYPSSFMPNGARLWFVAGSEPDWLDKEKRPGELSDGTGPAVSSKAPRKRKNQKREKKEESELAASSSTKKAPGAGAAAPAPPDVVENDAKIGRQIWAQLEKTISDDELREKLWKYLWRTYAGSVRSAAAQEGLKPGTFLALWLEDASRRLQQASWGTDLLNLESCLEIVTAMKLMLEDGLVPAIVDGTPPKRWNATIEGELYESLIAKVKEQGFDVIPVVE